MEGARSRGREVNKGVINGSMEKERRKETRENGDGN